MKQEQEIFEQAVELSSREAREVYLVTACGQDRDLRRSVDQLLASFNDAAEIGFLKEGDSSQQAQTVRLDTRLDEGPGTVIGRYKLLQAIGEGGMGVVYMAEQEEPVRRRVALKIIKRGMDTKSVIARFEAERQALAMMDHPNIAKVLDGGATDAGRPYFVMELVRGLKITEYCDEAKLSTRERLDLFIRVCQAIQHAHQKGIIHRDIKPSNILVNINDGIAVPKVIDFGIAKATEGRLTDKTLFTQFESLIGTPAYMSPEQAVMSSLDIDTRSDIYSLGVLLYELLTGSTPFDAKELLALGIDAMRKTIREKEPVRPSTRLATLQGGELTTTAKRRSADTPKLANQLKGDLDWIVMKCLEKDRARRYETANGIVADLKRHLNLEPVVARPSSAAYRFQKFVRRNKLAVTAVTTIAVVLALGVLVCAWLAFRATRASSSEAVQHQLADIQRAAAEEQRNVAVEQRKLADMQLALQAWEEGDLQRADGLIEASRPGPGHAPAFEWRYLRKLCQDQSRETFGDSIHQYRSALFIDRDLLLLNDGTTLTLRDLSSRKADQVRIADPDGIWSPAVCSGDTNLLATVTHDGRIKVWDLPTGRLRVEFEGCPRSLPASSEPQHQAINFSPDGRWLASASEDNSVKLWDVHGRNPKPIRTVHRYASWTSGGIFSSEGHLFSGGSESVVRSWSVTSGLEEGTPLEGHTSWVYTLAISPDGLRLASAGADSAVLVWDVVSRKPLRKFLGHSSQVMTLCFSPDGQILASGGRDHTIRLWDMQTGQQLSLLRGHTSRVRWVRFSPDGQWLVSRSRDGLVKHWQATPGLEANVLTGGRSSLQHVAWSPDGRHLASVGTTNFAVDLWGLSPRSRTVLNGHSEVVMCAAFSPDSRTLATGSHDHTVRLWDVDHHRALAVLTNEFPVGSLAFSLDGRTLTVGGSKNSFIAGGRGGLQFWDVASRKASGTVPGEASDIVQIALSADGTLLASGHNEGAISLWEARTRRLLHRFEGSLASSVMGLAFSATEPLLAASDWAGNIVLYNTQTKKVVPPPLKAHSERVMSIAFSPDGRTLASAGDNGGLKLWHVAMRQVALTLKGHAGLVTGIAFSPDGACMATSGVDGTVRLWLAVPVEPADPVTKR
jgi:WD40 repeat protein/serine/threonine protein kinase